MTKLPAGLLLVGIQNFPIKGRVVLNFYLQGIAVFLASAVVGFLMGYTVPYLAH